MAVPYLTPTQIRAAVPALTDTTKFPDQTLADMVATFEAIAERYRNVAFTPRTTVESHTLYFSVGSIQLRRKKARSITSIVIDGTTIDPTSYTLSDSNEAVSRVGFIVNTTMPAATAVITYDHGFDGPDPSLLRACRVYVRASALADRAEMSRDVIGQTVDGMTLRYSTPDASAGRPTGFIDVDALLNQQPWFPSIA